jgi:hypothetical protein
MWVPARSDRLDNVTPRSTMNDKDPATSRFAERIQDSGDPHARERAPHTRPGNGRPPAALPPHRAAPVPAALTGDAVGDLVAEDLAAIHRDVGARGPKGDHTRRISLGLRFTATHVERKGDNDRIRAWARQQNRSSFMDRPLTPSPAYFAALTGGLTALGLPTDHLDTFVAEVANATPEDKAAILDTLRSQAGVAGFIRHMAKKLEEDEMAPQEAALDGTQRPRVLRFAEQPDPNSGGGTAVSRDPSPTQAVPRPPTSDRCFVWGSMGLWFTFFGAALFLIPGLEWLSKLFGFQSAVAARLASYHCPGPNVFTDYPTRPE